MSAAPWVSHFGLTRTPFGKRIAAKDLFVRDAHAEAVARISFCVMESALGVITGDVGAGKTVAVRAAVAGLDPTRHQVIYVANPAFGTRGLYVTIVRALGAEPRFHKAEVMAQAADLLAAEEAERHRRVVIMVDEAHLLDPAQLEELRLLTNAEMDSASPFAGILVGQPTLSRQLRLGTFAALDQRIVTRFGIKAMDIGESAAYLRHHLALAGREEPLFADDAVARLHRVGQRPAPGAQQRRHRRAHRRRLRRQGPRRRRLRQEGRRRAHPPGLTADGYETPGTAVITKPGRPMCTERRRLMCRERGRQQAVFHLVLACDEHRGAQGQRRRTPRYADSSAHRPHPGRPGPMAEPHCGRVDELLRPVLPVGDGTPPPACQFLSEALGWEEVSEAAVLRPVQAVVDGTARSTAPSARPVAMGPCVLTVRRMRRAR